MPMFWCVRRRGVRADTRYLPPGGSVGAFAVLALVRAGLLVWARRMRGAVSHCAAGLASRVGRLVCCARLHDAASDVMHFVRRVCSPTKWTRSGNASATARRFNGNLLYKARPSHFSILGIV